MNLLAAARRRGAGRNSSSAFTLIELLVVIVVIAVLSMIIIPKFADQSKRSKEATLRSNLRLLRSAVATFQSDTGLYPETLDNLAATSATGLKGFTSAGGAATAVTASDWRGPYVEITVPKDPISGTPFSYSTTSPTVGKVSSSATGNGLDGTAYSTW